MAISKRQSKLLAWGILAVTILAFILTIALQNREHIDLATTENLPDLPSEAGDLTIESTVESRIASSGTSTSIKNSFDTEGPAKAELQTFHRVETRNGKTLWEIKASHGKLMPETSSAVIETATLLLYRPSGEVVRVKADQALVKLEGATLTSADLTGNVQLAIEGTIDARTETATLNRKTQVLHAPEHVTIQSKGIFVEGDGLTGNLQNEQFTIHREVATVITPQS